LAILPGGKAEIAEDRKEPVAPQYPIMIFYRGKRIGHVTPTVLQEPSNKACNPVTPPDRWLF